MDLPVPEGPDITMGRCFSVAAQMVSRAFQEGDVHVGCRAHLMEPLWGE